MNRGLTILVLIAAGLFLWPVTCPAPLVYRPGEGLTYEPIGGPRWQKARAEDQFKVAQAAFEAKQYRLAIKAARRTLKKWPASDYAPQAAYVLARSYEARRLDEKAFKEYQNLIEKYPKVVDYKDVLQRQYEIANRFLAGQWFKLWGVIPFFPSMDKTVDMYSKIILSGPYSEVAPPSQLKIGQAREKQKDYMQAVRAYEKAADTYHDQKPIAAEGLYKAGLAYNKQAKTAEYDQSIAGQAIATLDEFATLYPNDSRTSDARKVAASLKTEQARGSFMIARFYERKHIWDGALVYYNEVLIKDPDSSYAAEAKQRIEDLKKRRAPKPAPATKQQP